ncbi:hypothetical protein BLA9940_03665 [Burkholderia aenigmatica]|uniref:Uncharacterized protein n=1 Tax=Burkholderia aenigmatica TaxID=2015348 RepID=A0A6P2JPF9_9BURK|nr:hypothetical protein BLA13014_01891 [Burkholderia aenigmatica]VWC65749.1 hypothetical protein BLA9940_03665 [Burkholderia aenigmatica]VWD13011.1 hypothetical protein BLA18628_03333 [Burkholderia aenigmatica]
MICRIDVSRPPGVSSCRIASGACWRAARSSERTMKSALAGPIAPLIGITTTGRAAAGASAGGGAATAAHTTSSAANSAARATRADSG